MNTYKCVDCGRKITVNSYSKALSLPCCKPGTTSIFNAISERSMLPVPAPVPAAPATPVAPVKREVRVETTYPEAPIVKTVSAADAAAAGAAINEPPHQPAQIGPQAKTQNVSAGTVLPAKPSMTPSNAPAPEPAAPTIK